MMKIQRLWALGCLSLLAACGGGGDDKGLVDPPVAQLKASALTAQVGDTLTLDGSGSSSPRDAALAYNWQLALKPATSAAALSHTDTSSTAFVADIPGEYRAQLVVHDGTTVSLPAVVTIQTTTDVPVVIAENRHNILVGRYAELDASTSIPPTGVSPDRLSYQWTLLEKPADSAAVVPDGAGSKWSLFADVLGEYKLRLVVRYGEKASTPLDILVQAGTGNVKPVAEVTQDTYEVYVGEKVLLDGSKSYDPDNTSEKLNYRWSFLAPNFVMQTSARVVLPSPSDLKVDTAIENDDKAVAAITPDAVGQYELYFYVHDGISISDVKSVKVVAKRREGAANTPPVASFRQKHRYAFYEPVYSDEWTLNSPYTVYSAAQSYDADGGSASLQPRFYWVSAPEGFVKNELPNNRPRITPNIPGIYQIGMIVNDGEVDSAPAILTLNARNGARSQPYAMAQVDIQTVKVGDTAWFDAKNSAMMGGAELGFHWYLLYKPEGSAASTATLKKENAVFERSGQGNIELVDARAGVVTDKPGLYHLLVYTTTAEGYTSDVSSVSVLAKDRNNPPAVDTIYLGSASNSHNGNLHFNDTDQPYVVNGASIPPEAAGVVDPDSDRLYAFWSLEQPAGSGFDATYSGEWGTSFFNQYVTAKENDANSSMSTRNFRPSVPGNYHFTYVVSDGVEYSSPRTLKFKAVTRENYPSLLLEDLHMSSKGSNGSSVGQWDHTNQDANSYNGNGAHPAVSQRSFPYFLQDNVFNGLINGADNVVKTYRLTAFDKDYTITNLRTTKSTENPAGMAASFRNLKDKQVIRKGESVEFELIVNPSYVVEGKNNLNGLGFYFDVAERAGWTFGFAMDSYY